MTRTLTIGGIALAVIAVIAAAALVLPTATAQEPSPTPSDEATTPDDDAPAPDEDRSRRQERRAERRERVLAFRSELAADLAEQLGLPVEEVEAAFRGVVAQRLDDAVAAGDLTQERADELLEAYDAGAFPRGFGPGGYRHRGHGHGGGPWSGWFPFGGNDS